jgi:hypothetical protein
MCVFVMLCVGGGFPSYFFICLIEVTCQTHYYTSCVNQNRFFLHGMFAFVAIEM